MAFERISKKIKFEPGLGRGFNTKSGRVLNNKGNFNVDRVGGKLDLRDVFQHLVNMPWGRFLCYLVVFFILGNAFFAMAYVGAGLEGIQGATTGNFWHEFKQAFFFSIQTAATVGYGHLAPKTDLINLLAATETLIGLLTLSIATGLLYGRFSRPHSSIVYSNSALISPYNDKKSFQFKIVNRRAEVLADVEVGLVFVRANGVGENIKMEYFNLKLEVSKVAFMPLTWTLVHAIDEDSPLFNTTEKELIEQDVEFIIQIKGFDETYGQLIYSRNSYTTSNLVWDAKFESSFDLPQQGPTVLYLDKLHNFKRLA